MQIACIRAGAKSWARTDRYFLFPGNEKAPASPRGLVVAKSLQCRSTFESNDFNGVFVQSRTVVLRIIEIMTHMD